MFYLELISGLRKGELVALQWSDLDEANGTISVSFSLAEVIAKGASSDVYRLTLSGGEANFTLADADITALLGK